MIVNMYKIFLSIASIYITYSFITIIFSKNINDKINLLFSNIKQYDNKKINYFKKKFFNNKIRKIQKVKKIYSINNKYLNIFNFYIFSLILAILFYIISNMYIKIKSTSFILSIFFYLIPNFILDLLIIFHKNRIIKYFPIFLLELKNYTKTSNDIIQAIKFNSKNNILSKYLIDFNLCIESGLSIFNSFELLKKNIGIKEIEKFIEMLKKCYINGGSFYELLSRYYDYYSRKNKMFQKEEEKRLSIFLVLIFTIVINIYFVFSFVLSNPDYAEIIRNTFVGRLLINFNVLIYLIIFLIINKSNKMEE